jgi:hypothetical protein
LWLAEQCNLTANFSFSFLVLLVLHKAGLWHSRVITSSLLTMFYHWCWHEVRLTNNWIFLGVIEAIYLTS